MKQMLSVLFVSSLWLSICASPAFKDSTDRDLRKGYNLIVEYGVGRWETQYLGFYVGSAYLLNAYTINPYVSVGLGVELDYRNEFFSIPMELACRVYSSKRKQALFFSGSIGYNLNGEAKVSGAPCAGAGMGIRFRLSHKFSLLLHLNYHALRQRYPKPWENFHYIEHNYSLRLGFSF